MPSNPALFDSRRTLRCASTDLITKHIGVTVSAEYPHAGSAPQHQVVDIGIDVPELATFNAVRLSVPAEEWRRQATVCGSQILLRIDAIISELKEHREKLSRDIATLHFSGDPGRHSPAFVLGFEAVFSMPPTAPENPFAPGSSEFSDWADGARDAGINDAYKDGVLNPVFKR